MITKKTYTEKQYHVSVFLPKTVATTYYYSNYSNNNNNNNNNSNNKKIIIIKAFVVDRLV